MNPSPKNWNPGWPTKMAAAMAGGFMALLSLSSPKGYGLWGAITASAGALLVPIVAFRGFWSMRRFWIVAGFLALLQIPLVIVVREMVEQHRFPIMLGFGAVDCVFVIAVIYRLCSEP